MILHKLPCDIPGVCSKDCVFLFAGSSEWVQALGGAVLMYLLIGCPGQRAQQETTSGIPPYPDPSA